MDQDYLLKSPVYVPNFRKVHRLYLPPTYYHFHDFHNPTLSFVPLFATFCHQVVSFDNLENDEIERRAVDKNWDQIIPQKQLEEIQQEERLKEIQEMNLGPRQRKSVTNVCVLHNYHQLYTPV